MSTQPKDAGLELTRTEQPRSISKLIDLEFSTNALYPPLRGSTARVQITLAPQEEPKDLAFQLSLNGQTGTPAGMELNLVPEQGIGHLLVGRTFIEQYRGTWPIALKLLALRDGTVVDEASLSLHDTRRIAPARMEENVYPSTRIEIPTRDDAWVVIMPTFYDRNDVLLPVEELSWFVQLHGQPTGVIHHGHLLQITPEARPGKVQAMLHSAYGLQLTITLTLEQGRGTITERATGAADFELIVSHRHLYAPATQGAPTVYITYAPAEPAVGLVRYVVKVNGEEGSFAGMSVSADDKAQTGRIEVDYRFLDSWRGTWPVKVNIHVMHNFQEVAVGEVVMHNLRTGLRPAVRAEWKAPPAGSPISIPTDKPAYVVAMVSFYDENDALLPYQEPAYWQWSVDLPVPHDGIGMIKHVIEVTPQARPGQFELVASESQGLTSRMIFTLV